MAFQFFSNDVLSIDIGFRFIKVVKVRKTKSGDIVVVNFGLGDTPRNSIRNGQIIEKEKVIQEIKRVISENGLHAKEAKIVMSGTNIITRIIMVDRVSDSELDKVIWEEINKSIFINVEEHRLDYKILDTVIEGGREKVRVFVTAVPRKIIESYVDILKALGLKPVAVDIPANSASKLFQREIIHTNSGYVAAMQKFGPSRSNTVAVLDMGSETTIVNILRAKVPEFNRVLLIGGSNIDLEIFKRLNFDKSQLDLAERYKKMYGIVRVEDRNNDVEVKCSEAAKYVVSEIIKNVKMCFEFYIKRCGGEQISEIYLVGGGSKLKGIREFMEELMGISTYTIDQINVSGIEFSQGLDKDRINFLINAIGVAL